MQVINEQIKIDRINQFIKIPISMNNDYIGIDQEQNGFINDTINNSINPIIDNETIRFKYDPNLISLLYFNFGPDIIPLNQISWTDAGFTESEVNGKWNSFRNSFIIFEVFNSPYPQNQDKYALNFQTKFTNWPELNLGVNITNNSEYTNTELNYLFMPKHIIESNPNNIQIYYARISFFNSKTGKIIIFYDKTKANILTSDKLYNEIQLNKSTNTWKFNNQEFMIVYRELTNADSYVNKLNNTIQKNTNIIQQYPNGDKKYVTFDNKTGNYI